MKLVFRCRSCASLFESDQWELVDGGGVVEDESGARRLSGFVRVVCPVCGRSLEFRPDELACPFGHGR